MKTLESISDYLSNNTDRLPMTPESLRGRPVPNGFGVMAIAICLAREIDLLKERIKELESRSPEQESYKHS